MITRRGVGILVTAIAVFFLASTTRVGWVHLADAVLWGLLLMSLAVPWLSAPGLKVVRKLEQGKRENGSIGPIEGDELPVSLELENRWWLPRFLVSVSYPVTAAGVESTHRNIFFWSWPRRKSTTDATVQLERRGQHTLGAVTVEVTGPFGMFRRRRVTEMKHAALAYPRWLPVQRLGLMEVMSGDMEGRKKSRTGSDASGTRAYVPGDSYRSIHWRNSARSGRLAVREFDTWNDRSVIFAIDSANVRGESPGSSLDYAARIAGSCARVIEREGGTVSVMTPAGESPEFMAWHGVMEHLARLEPVEQPGAASLAMQLSSLQPGRRVMAFLTAGSEHETAAVCAAAQRGVACVAVVYSEQGDEGQREPVQGVHALRQAGVPVVRCVPGGLEHALAAIENGTGFAGGPVRRSAPPRLERSAGNPDDERMAA